MVPSALQTDSFTSTTQLHLASPSVNCGSASHGAVEVDLAKCVSRALATARAVQSDWALCSLRNRLSVLKKLRLKIASDPRALALTFDRQDQAETLAAEVLPLLDACRFLEFEASSILRETVVGRRGRPTWLWGNRIVLRHEPMGVVLIIAPSNYPLMLPGIQALQAIAAGNTVLIKPAEGGTQPVLALVSQAKNAGLPDGLIQILPEATEAATLAIRQGVDKVFLTGSARTGKAVCRELAESTTPSVMELSGCDAVFVLQDADLELVANCLQFGLTLNNSQTCMAPRRVFATNQQTDDILKRLRAKLSAGNLNPSSLQQDRFAGVTRAKILQAVAQGAEIVLGNVAKVTTESHSDVTLLDHVTADMSIVQSDVFAPVVSFLRVDSEAQALELSKRCPFALSASVFGSADSCQQFARRIHAGCVVINDVIVPTADPRVPFGGRGMSGHGMTRGHAGLLEMTQLKAIVTSRRWFKPHLQSKTAADADVLEQLIRLEHAASPLKSLSIVPKMIRATMQQMQLRRIATNEQPA